MIVVNSVSCTQRIYILDTTGPVANHDKPLPVVCIDPDDVPTFDDLVADGTIYADDNCDNDPTITLVNQTQTIFPPDHPFFPCYTADNYFYQAF